MSEHRESASDGPYVVPFCISLFGYHVGEWCDSGDPDYFECSACGDLVRVKG